jgi:hypothetical protein
MSGSPLEKSCGWQKIEISLEKETANKNPAAQILRH